MWRKTASVILLLGVLASQVAAAGVDIRSTTSMARNANPDPLRASFTWGQLAANVVGWAAGSAAGVAVASAVIGTPAAGATVLAAAVAGGVAGGVADAVTQLWPFRREALLEGHPANALD